jgi:hypothetical protein
MGLQHREAMQSTRGTAKMRAREVVFTLYELEPPAGLEPDAELAFVRSQVEYVLTHEKGGYMWGTFSNVKDSVCFSLSYCISLLHIDSRRSPTMVATLC